MSKDFLAVGASTVNGKPLLKLGQKKKLISSGTSGNRAAAMPEFRFCSKKERKVALEACETLCKTGLGGYKSKWYKECHKNKKEKAYV